MSRSGQPLLCNGSGLQAALDAEPSAGTHDSAEDGVSWRTVVNPLRMELTELPRKIYFRECAWMYINGISLLEPA
ncbi:hypothetical protein KIN20_031620 [Parelaphostrongylus tenuis]|uniref:Uncharacterized protein n=1 Tax=Parelaphostrongylus tenuis TaxID=148309 RepID=A0AAD5R5S0_PARTN|nr:hypothetical protein KIN20_031620 [Parelaphostrongylus tenuis]